MDQYEVNRPSNRLYEGLVTANGLILIAVWCFILPSLRQAVLAGFATYILLVGLLRLIFLRDHNAGMKLMRKKQYAEAAEAFSRSEAYFAKHPKVDKFRFITIFSSSAIPYRQMALNNMGICYREVGEYLEALKAFRQLAELNPDFPEIQKTIKDVQQQLEFPY